MSSSAYSAELRCDETLRRVVLGSSVAATAIGVALAATLPLHPSLRVILCCGWVAAGGLEYYRMRRAYSRFLRLRIDAEGAAWLRDRTGAWQAATVMPGSVLLRRVGWVRLTCLDGTRYAEPLRGHCRRNGDWRRLQVIWRHIGGVSVSC